MEASPTSTCSESRSSASATKPWGHDRTSPLATVASPRGPRAEILGRSEGRRMGLVSSRDRAIGGPTA